MKSELLRWVVASLANTEGGAWVHGRKSELLFLSWATMTCRGLLLRTRLFLASLGVWGRPWGVGAAGCYATMLGNDDPGLLCVLCCVAWVG